MHPLSLPLLALTCLLLMGCPPLFGDDPAICDDLEDTGELTIPILASTYCKNSGQKVNLENYCECSAPNESYNKETGACDACDKYSCVDRECGSDGCDGNCGRCLGGLRCIEGKCQPCEGNCRERQCGDDGCGRPCGSCESNSICDNGRCVSSDKSNLVTDCNCADVPAGAQPGARRFDTRCPTGVVQFEYCSPTQMKCTAPGVQAWRETCLTVPTGQFVTACNCWQPPAGRYGQIGEGVRIEAQQCAGKVAELQACRDAFGGMYPCVCGYDPFGNPVFCQWPVWTAVCSECKAD